MNIHVLNENSLNIPRGLYTNWLRNTLSDATANALIAEGAAIITKIPDAGLPVRTVTTDSGTQLQAPTDVANTTVIFGDSNQQNGYNIQARTFELSGVPDWANVLSGGRIVIISRLALGGSLITGHILNTQYPAALESGARNAFLIAATNDLANDVPLETIQAAIVQMHEGFMQKGIRFLVATVAPTGLVTINQRKTNEQKYNKWLQERMALYGKQSFVAVPLNEALVDYSSATGIAKAGFLRADQIHFTNRANYAGGKALASILTALFPPVLRGMVSALDSFALNPASNQLLRNPMLTGAGPVADNWEISATGVTTTSSIVVEAGKPNIQRMVQVAVASGNSCDFRQTGLQAGSTTPGPLTAGLVEAGFKYYVEAEIEVKDPVNLQGVRLALIATETGGSNNHVASVIARDNTNDQPLLEGFRGVFRTGVLEIPAGTPNLVAALVSVSTRYLGAGGATIEVKALELRKLPI